MKKKDTVKQTMIKKISNINERERNMFDRAVEMEAHNIKYYLPNKEAQDKETRDVGV
mgnify:CR=1 FL=1